VPLHDLQPTRLVAGQRAEPDMVADLVQVRPPGAKSPVPAQVCRGRLAQQPGTHVRQHQLGQQSLRVLRATEAPAQQRLGQRDGFLVGVLARFVAGLRVDLIASWSGEVFDPEPGLAAEAQRGPVRPGHGPPGVPPPRLVGVADVLGEAPAQHVHRAQAVPGQRVPLLHVVEDGLDAGQRYRREPGHPGDHPLEVPAQPVVDPVGAGQDAAVVLGQAPGERDERLGQLAALLVRRGGHGTGLQLQHEVTQGVGVPHRLFGHGDAGRPVRHLLAPLQQSPYPVGSEHDDGHPDGSWPDTRQPPSGPTESTEQRIGARQCASAPGGCQGRRERVSGTPLSPPAQACVCGQIAAITASASAWSSARLRWWTGS
jgi:hypothetical protein